MKNYFGSNLVIPFFVLTLILVGCNKSSNTPTQANISGTIQGKITSSIDGTVVSGASIKTNPITNTAISDQSGNFTISNVTSGAYILTVSKSGFLNTSLNIVVLSGKTTSANIALTLPDTIPASISLLSPGNDSTNVVLPPILSWNASSGASSYTLQVSIHGNFDSLIYNRVGLTNTSYQINGLSLSTTYYWRVNATNKYGTTNWSNPVWSFTTADIYGQPCAGLPTVNYGGQIYNTVQIGSQCWLRENLNIGSMIIIASTQTNNNVIEKYCYNNNSANCNTYGGLYQWDEAMQYTTNEKAQGICPNGWHIPSLAEIDTLRASIRNNGNSLKDVSQGNGSGTGTNISGFSALLAGYGSGGIFSSLGNNTTFWGSTQYDASTALGLYLTDYDASIAFSYFNKTSGFSVRCIKN